ncbi:MAG TPA: class I SAM-dependent methyltransferase [Gaiellaceae bacterium]|nr:class I SAM-dependent methyltransferase [Gaiellaceae bacterium]
MTDGGSSLPEVQKLLSVLAAGRRCAEAGTAFGEGAAAMAATAASVVTVELDRERAAVARERLAGLANVELLEGDWREQLPRRAPFELVFLDGGGFKHDPHVLLPSAVELLAVNGVLVLDDFTPGRQQGDPAREAIRQHPELLAVEILTTPATAAIVATRVPGASSST